MIKFLYLVATVFSTTMSILSFLQNVSTAQEYPGCFIIGSDGKIVSLDPLCKKRNDEKKLRIAMKANELYHQGIELGRKGFYKEAISNYTQAIKLNPNFAEAYVSRAIVRYLLEDKHGGVEDLQSAIDIYRTQGKSEIADILLGRLQEFQRDIQMGEEL
ncbi:tetratricopeptide repeat protein [Chroococcidiopsis thermalis]|uniref:Tetratricopeptide TPR_1 repeat-containing protein n=1 Tax=Chroococcidiopsis thermalis (strain PCC 7203) TaxID=251229 RepID=K9U574_CHRTP|nr:tetratricopeptide repeat protein [Chroococcidiopsis thermalis]AFY89581.1 Tetratricopeptide TPR_1 repeat-containing protein [Chroococcidiopsis thermalis PCC 7203]